MDGIPYWAREWMDAWRVARERAAASGHDVSRVTMGYWDGVARLCDDDGAYDVRLSHGGNTSHRSVGAPGRALEAVFYRRGC
jgi:hypothetical protein